MRGIILIGLVAVVLVLSGCLDFSDSEVDVAKWGEYANVPFAFDEVSFMMPTREEMSTEWRFDSASDNDYSTSGQSDFQSNVDTAPYVGLEQSATKDMRKDDVSVTIDLYKFVNQETAKTFMDEELAPIKEKGGYKEINVSRYGNYCYGTHSTAYITEHAKIRCVIKNVYVRIYARTNSFESAEAYAREVANIVIPKIK